MRVAQGAAIVLAFTIVNLVLQAPRIEAPAWLLVVMLAGVGLCGAVGGATYYVTDSLRARGGWHRTVANVGSLLAYSLLAFGLLLLAVSFL